MKQPGAIPITCERCGDVFFVTLADLAARSPASCRNRLCGAVQIPGNTLAGRQAVQDAAREARKISRAAKDAEKRRERAAERKRQAGNGPRVLKDAEGNVREPAKNLYEVHQRWIDSRK